MTIERTTPSEVPTAGEMDEREVDDNLDGSFPASDPPAWTLGTDHVADPDPQKCPDGESE